MADYTSIAEVRALDNLSDATTWPDATITEAIEYAEELIDNYTGTSWIHKAFTVTLDGKGGRAILLRNDEGYPVLFLRTITAVTIDGVSLSPADWSSWGLYPSGKVIRDSGSFPWATEGRNVVISGTAGVTSAAPKDISWAARTVAAQYAKDLVSRVPDRAMQVQNDFGTVMMAQASSNPDRPTSLPEVNARLARRRHIPDSAVF